MAIYSAKGAPKLKTKVAIFEKDGKTVKRSVPVQFKNGVFETEDAEVIAAFDKLIAEKPNFSALVTKINREAALKVSQEWQKNQAIQSQVSRGGTNSENANLARRAEQIRNEAISEGQTPEQAEKLIAELREQDLTLTDKVDPHVTSTREGFVPNSPGGKENGDPTASVPEGTEEQAKSAEEVAGAPSMKGNPFAKKD